jgi:hypothetical protein
MALAGWGLLSPARASSQSTSPSFDGGARDGEEIGGQQDTGIAGATRGARDPFVRPLTDSDDTPPAVVASLPRPAGPAGLSIDEIVVRGVLQAGGRQVALVQGPGTKQYVIRPGDRVRDGSVEAVLADAVVMTADPGAPGEPVLRQVRIPVRRAPEGR